MKQGSLVGGILLVGGTAIGGGMLALPVLTADGGFFPAVALYFLCWLFMASTALLLVETYLWSHEEVNLVSMAEKTLGKAGKVIAWGLYLYLFYSLTVAYVSGGGQLIVEALRNYWPQLPANVGPYLMVALFAPFVVISAHAVDRINSVLMIGLIVSFLAFVVLGAGHVDARLLTHAHWKSAVMAAPVLFTSFAFQGLVPTLTTYLGRDPHRVRLVIWLGSAIPLLIYVLWEWLILGVIPHPLLQEAVTLGQSAVFPLKKILHAPWLFQIGQFFAFFAIVTSFLGVTLGLLDFLADGLRVKKTLKGRTLLAFLIYIPPLVLAVTNPCLFLNALTYAGGLGCALLLGLIPILMVWRGRYGLKLPSLYSLAGGRLTLSLLLLFVLGELIVMAIKF